MRNGNRRGYTVCWNLRKVLTVPMRNGNPWQNTMFTRTQSVLTVPMRNGNSRHQPFSVCKTFLPYLWGMETFHPITRFFVNIPSSYRTYEEWKHVKVCISIFRRYSSYRTYEEWKHIQNLPTDYQKFPVLTVPMRNGNNEGRDFDGNQAHGSYRTYEEWKQYKWMNKRHTRGQVLTVPMRNGNSSISYREPACFYYSFSVPMYIWNHFEEQRYDLTNILIDIWYNLIRYSHRNIHTINYSISIWPCTPLILRAFSRYYFHALSMILSALVYVTELVQLTSLFHAISSHI